MEITEILRRINEKRIACILEDRVEVVPILEQLLHLAILVARHKEHPNSEPYIETRNSFQKVLELVPETDRPFPLIK